MVKEKHESLVRVVKNVIGDLLTNLPERNMVVSGTCRYIILATGVVILEEGILKGLLKMKPLLKWVGGKSWFVPRLEKHYNGNQFVEPFCGGLSVALGLNPNRSLLNDINPHLINFYEWVKICVR